MSLTSKLAVLGWSPLSSHMACVFLGLFAATEYQQKRVNDRFMYAKQDEAVSIVLKLSSESFDWNNLKDYRSHPIFLLKRSKNSQNYCDLNLGPVKHSGMINQKTFWVGLNKTQFKKLTQILSENSQHKSESTTRLVFAPNDPKSTIPLCNRTSNI